MIAIPCIVYVADAHDPAKGDEIKRALDKKRILIQEAHLKGELLPDWSRDAYTVGSYQTPSGPRLYNIILSLQYHDPKEVPEDDAKPGDYPFSVNANNSLEAAERALDQFHATNPIDNLDNADIGVSIIWPEDCQHDWQTFNNEAVQNTTVCIRCGLLKK